MGGKINPASAYITGVVLGVPGFLVAGKAFVWIMAVIGHAG